MKKYLLTKLLLISQYLYVLIAVPLIIQNGLSAKVMQILFIILCCFAVVILIPNMIYAILLFKRGENASVLLFWDMLLKLCNIPIYIVCLLFGIVMGLFPLGFVIVFIIGFFDYILLLPSTIYGVFGLIQARRERRISTSDMVINIISHFIFCIDVFSAVEMYRIVKPKSKKLKKE